MTTTLTVATAARIMREAVKDKSYRYTPLGATAARYLRWKQNEWGAAERTLEDYELPLARLALSHADHSIEDFEPPMGTEWLREFLAEQWGGRAAGTRRKVLACLRDFFAWCVREGLLHGNPTTPITSPKGRGVERGVISPNHILKIVASQPKLQDRVALRLLFALALRKGELTAIQFKHFDFARKRLTVFGKGGTVTPMPVVDGDLLLDLERLILERKPEPDEYLLYPVTRGPGRYDRLAGEYEIVVKREYKLRPLSGGAMHRWWKGCLVRAKVPDYKLHEARHTAITDFLRGSGNLELARQLARHKSIQTTADVYSHLDDVDLEREMRKARR